ncbi:hypothetical protein DSO57_1035744 [Entomophthora muscae]|uniref:Uncharacterized protein n=1 Tax=Entomophthora muscae TaxID=34485 RepID=A0ACC2RE87_9FUNG|nr:hypothetical protein DSO57_1035744 [Entomophthora muscae]
MSKPRSITVMGKTILESLIPVLSNKCTTSSLNSSAEDVVNSEFSEPSSRLNRIKVFAGFLFDLLPSELQELVLKLFRLLLQRVESYDAQRKYLPWFVALNRWGITPSSVYVIKLAFCGLALIKVYRASRQLCFTLMSCAYPAICTATSLASHEHEARNYWLTYWLLYSGFQGADCGGKWIKPIFPFYPLAKIVALTWAQHPTTFGARTIYQKCFSRKKPRSRSSSPINNKDQDSSRVPSSTAPFSHPATPVAGPLPKAAYIEEENVWTSDLETSGTSASSPGSPAEAAATYLEVINNQI